MRLLLFALTVFLTTALTPAEAPGASDATADIRACADARMLTRITERFAWAERKTWRRGYLIASIEDSRLRYTAFKGPSMIRHRHCRATALMTNGARRTLFYTISAGMGLASIGDSVDYCLAGLDPWRVHGAACRSLR